MASETKDSAWAKWPNLSDDSNRLVPEALPCPSTSFKITPGTSVFTMGSCFARNIEAFLGQSGFAVPVLDYDGPIDEASGGRPQGVLNKFTLPSMEQELLWVKSIVEKGGKVDWADIEKFMLSVGDDKFVDMHLATGIAVAKDRAVERRQRVFEVHRTVFSAETVVLTPGLTEVWYDKQSSLYVETLPYKYVRRSADRFEFRVLGFEECCTSLMRTITMIKGSHACNIVITVSPVPLLRTFTNKDVIIANAYSKSTLRAVVGKVTDEFDGVDYFPSYEMVTMTHGPEVWEDDLRHVRDGFVAKVVQRFQNIYSPGSISRLPTLVVHFVSAVEKSDVTVAQEILKEIGGDRDSITSASFWKSLGKFALTGEDYKTAETAAEKLREVEPNRPAGYLIGSQAAKHLGRKQDGLKLLKDGRTFVGNHGKKLLNKRIKAWSSSAA